MEGSHYLDIEEWNQDEDGSIYVHDDNALDIILPNFVWPTRNRFTIAHELGHYFLHRFTKMEFLHLVKANGKNSSLA